MSRARLVPSLNLRQKSLIDMSFKNEVLRGFDYIEIWGASTVDDAHYNPVKLFDVKVGAGFRSPSLRRSTRIALDSNADHTRFYFDLGDYATLAPLPRIPTDNEVFFVRIRGHFANNGLFSAFGPIVCVPPYDFFTTTHPTFTFTAYAPQVPVGLLGVGEIPENLGEGCMNVHLPYFSQTVQVVNLDGTVDALYMSFHPGMTPTEVPAGKEIGLTGAGVPEIFACSLAGTGLDVLAANGERKGVKFTIRMSLVNAGA